MVTKVVSYIRFSSGNQLGNTSVGVQRGENNRYIRKTFPGAEIIEIVDEAQTGMDFNREGFNELCRLAASGDIEAVVVSKYDRFGRDLAQSAFHLRELERVHSVSVHSATEGTDSFLRNILLSVAELYSEQLSQRCKSALENLTKRGFAANKPPYGYRIKRVSSPAGGKKNATFEIVPEEAEVVKRIFVMRGKRATYLEIATALNEDGIPSARGGSWKGSSVRSILLNERYLGHAINGQVKRDEAAKPGRRFVKLPRSKWTIFKNAFPAIITRYIWNKARKFDGRGKRQRKRGPTVLLA